jgi:hypothetical protein
MKDHIKGAGRPDIQDSDIQDSDIQDSNRHPQSPIISRRTTLIF